jgi:hypothetical protein
VSFTGNHVVNAVHSPPAIKVTFDRNVANCAYAATGRAGTVDRIQASTDPADASSVLVLIIDGEAPAFRDFSLIVAC